MVADGTVVLALELPEEDFQKVSEAQKDEIKKQMEDADNLLVKLIDYLNVNGFEKTATYIAGARKNMFSYVQRHLKKLAYNWSDKGAAKISRIILRKFTNKTEWEAYWKDRLGIVGNVAFDIDNYKITAQNLRH